ncbi:TOTE conflict system archaeo-eukaryotic primase domain-containing protein [Petrocella sp. FN5]|uniref:TOTE conflict system archaeo-eukaryotic primase domain-containing protein n=1 Tax=Petrocella sp. FN5 TaxID=3032002 RepID=UPI0023DB2E6C|nr:MucR family transcriptional regulator [Petrocella sp. FN5]MDF1617314.1 hypothetical protein [Petrocella sp. FN5]
MQEFIKKYAKIHELFYRRTFKDKGFKCEICGKELKIFHAGHLKKCGITKEEYIEKYGYPNRFYEMDAVLKMLVSKVYDLYITTTSKWLELPVQTRVYKTIDKRNKDEYLEDLNKNRRLLNSMNIINHFKGVSTLGVFPKWGKSKFLIIDIDSHVGLKTAQKVAKDIKTFYKKFIPEKYIHINFSGNKGYHVTLFFDQFIELKDLYRLYNIVLTEIHADKFEDVFLEMRPTRKGIQGHGVKLPLGANFTNLDDYNNYAFFVDKNFEPVTNEIEYFLSIEKIDGKIIYKILYDYKGKQVSIFPELNHKKDEKQDISNDLDKVKDIKEYREGKQIKGILENGLKEVGTRHYWSFLIAMYLKKEGFSDEETYEKLLAWSKKQCMRGMSKSNLNEIENDLRGIIFKGVFNKKKHYNLSNSNQINGKITVGNTLFEKIELLNSIKLSSSIRRINLQKILFVMEIHGSYYCDDEGHYTMSYDQIRELSNVGSFTTIAKSISELQSLGILIIIKRENKFNEDLWIKEPNIYSIDEVKLQDKDNSFEVDYHLLGSELYFYNCLKEYFGEKKLKKVLSRSVRSRFSQDINNCVVI